MDIGRISKIDFKIWDSIESLIFLHSESKYKIIIIWNDIRSISISVSGKIENKETKMVQKFEK